VVAAGGVNILVVFGSSDSTSEAKEYTALVIEDGQVLRRTAGLHRKYQVEEREVSRGGHWIKVLLDFLCYFVILLAEGK
jgi:hypothetical protein